MDIFLFNTKEHMAYPPSELIRREKRENSMREQSSKSQHFFLLFAHYNSLHGIQGHLKNRILLVLPPVLLW
jgi:hypothetical protein